MISQDKIITLLDQASREHANSNPKNRYLTTEEIFRLLGIDPESFTQGMIVGRCLAAEVRGPDPFKE